MKVCLLSDSHGNIETMFRIIQKEQPDLVLHAGDCAADVAAMITKHVLDVELPKIYTVAGNCDLPNAAKPEQNILIDNLSVFLTHGHRYQVKQSYMNLVYKAQEVQAHMVVFGHTHVPVAFVEQGILFINPGSISLPRGYRTPTYVAIEVGPNLVKPINIKFKDVDRNPCEDLSIQVAWDSDRRKMIY